MLGGANGWQNSACLRRPLNFIGVDWFVVVFVFRKLELPN